MQGTLLIASYLLMSGLMGCFGLAVCWACDLSPTDVSRFSLNDLRLASFLFAPCLAVDAALMLPNWQPAAALSSGPPALMPPAPPGNPAQRGPSSTSVLDDFPASVGDSKASVGAVEAEETAARAGATLAEAEANAEGRLRAALQEASTKSAARRAQRDTQQSGTAQGSGEAAASQGAAEEIAAAAPAFTQPRDAAATVAADAVLAAGRARGDEQGPDATASASAAASGDTAGNGATAGEASAPGSLASTMSLLDQLEDMTKAAAAADAATQSGTTPLLVKLSEEQEAAMVERLAAEHEAKIAALTTLKSQLETLSSSRSERSAVVKQLAHCALSHSASATATTDSRRVHGACDQTLC